MEHAAEPPFHLVALSDRTRGNATWRLKQRPQLRSPPSRFLLERVRRRAQPRLRSHLKAIGLLQERPELFKSTPERRQIRVHDLRGTFVTVALANGRSEAWISDRTGHRSSAMIAKYKRTARTFSELSLGDLAPLAEALPELRTGPSAPLEGGPKVGQRSEIQDEKRRPQRDLKRY